MSLVSLKDSLKNANSNRPPSAAARHHKRRIATAIAIFAGVGIITASTFSIWKSHKDKAERIEKNPYSVEAVVDRFPEKKEAYSHANFYSLQIDSLSRNLLTVLWPEREKVLYTFTNGLTGETKYLTFQISDSILTQYFVGGPKNPVNLSKSDYSVLKEMLRPEDGVVVEVNASSIVNSIWTGNILNILRARSEMRSLHEHSSVYSIKLDSLAGSLQNRAGEAQTACAEQLRGLNEGTKAFVKNLPNASIAIKASDEKLEQDLHRIDSVSALFTEALQAYRLGYFLNSPALSKSGYDSIANILVKYSKLFDSMSKTFASSSGANMPVLPFEKIKPK